ncbi:hypothetical protein SAMN05443575_1966 [Jatrophihabitans endophyticus]|uniref:Arabinofuranosyltransferase n=1 Tax=Jatrophihabitans endophyticus TaxID=1206085 RepID=A0A1M5IPS2_9ACTN|nr:hypothetical protein [Jatrophihabitans endophyticus]SHG30312.1 hypothetical protein SAMN05443575_1966 [Jatrophihabitans endophyticus]
MSATVTAEASAPTTPSSAVDRPVARRRLTRGSLAAALPTVVTALNAVAFFLVRPDVNDLWAARARAAAVHDGVGLTYWFGWFGGGSTPGTYSVVTPPLAALVGTELLCALAAVAVAAIGTLAVRRTRYPLAGAWAVACAAVANLWSGRVPFLLGAALAIGAVIALRRRNRSLTVALTLASMLASPVSGAFLVIGLSGTFLTTRTRAWRPIIAWAVGATLVALVAVAVVFGTPGPEPFSAWLALELLVLLALLWSATPPDHVRTTILWSAAAIVVLWAVPNGMGSNFARFVWFCLPVVVLATTRRPVRIAALLVAPALIAGASGTVADLRNSARPVSSVEYYRPLADRLDQIGDLSNYRVEVVNHGAHAGYDALLDHAMLARGWETQQDSALNQSLKQDPLAPITYKLWLDNNAVGYVALPAASVGPYPEYDLVRSRTPRYLRLVWRSPDWKLYRVGNPTPIVGAPARIVRHTQSTMSVSVPCACRIAVRVRYSKFLQASLVPATGSGRRPTTSRPEVVARIGDDGSDWTTMTTPRAGTYELSGSLRGLLR